MTMESLKRDEITFFYNHQDLSGGREVYPLQMLRVQTCRDKPGGGIPLFIGRPLALQRFIEQHINGQFLVKLSMACESARGMGTP